MYALTTVVDVPLEVETVVPVDLEEGSFSSDILGVRWGVPHEYIRKPRSKAGLRSRQKCIHFVERKITDLNVAGGVRDMNP